MQTFPQYGLTITLLNKNLRNEYLELKANLEEIGRLASVAPDCVRATLLSDHVHWLTVCATENNAFLGIYNGITGQISQDILYDAPIITQKDCDSLKYRIELFIENGFSMHHTKIEDAWEALFEKKRKMQERCATHDEQER